MALLLQGAMARHVFICGYKLATRNEWSSPPPLNLSSISTMKLRKLACPIDSPNCHLLVSCMPYLCSLDFPFQHQPTLSYHSCFLSNANKEDIQNNDLNNVRNLKQYSYNHGPWLVCKSLLYSNWLINKYNCLFYYYLSY